MQIDLIFVLKVLRNPIRREAPSLKGMDRDLERERFARHMQFEGAVPQVISRKQKDVSEEDLPTEQILAVSGAR